jgi:hypothetical protein
VFDYTPPPTLNDVRIAVEQLRHVPFPDIDAEHLPVNSPVILQALAPAYQQIVVNAVNVVFAYTQDRYTGSRGFSKRSQTEIRKIPGCRFEQQSNQYNPMQELRMFVYLDAWGAERRLAMNDISDEVDDE